MNQAGAKLPAGLADPLHIFSPWSSMAMGITLGIIAAILIISVLIYLLRKSKQSPAATLPPDRPTVRVSGFPAFLKELREQYGEKNQDHRQGCHVLSAGLKAHLEKRTGVQVEEMTVSDIGRVFNKSSSEFFSHLSGLQFGVDEPHRQEFLRALKTAKRVANAKPVRKKKKKSSKPRKERVQS